MVGGYAQAQSKNEVVTRIEPPHWWTGFKNQELQLLVHHQTIAQCTVKINKKGVRIVKTTPGDSENYLFIDLIITPEVTGDFDIVFLKDNNETLRLSYTLNERKKKAEAFIGFDQSDAVYLITPDRFANGNPNNDQFDYLKQKGINREDDYARHGGDIEGITNHLDYIEGLGFTALWSSPLLTNDMPQQSYHGYAMTNFYEVDPRFGSLEAYLTLAKKRRKEA